ncbi:MAG TPA: hypothetical protein VGG19_11680 [Tepidisphaeraceae bacterium]|jgi:hypothetical protein
MGRDENHYRYSFLFTLAVVILLLLAAGVFSYLWAYALSDALVAGHLMSPLESGTDPRPQQMQLAFEVILGVLAFITISLKWLSYRHLRRIDAMNRE